MSRPTDAPSTRVKICGCRKPADAVWAADAGADFVGVVFAERTRRVGTGEAREVLAAVRGRLGTVGVFVDATTAEVLSAYHAVGFDIAQLHGAESPDMCSELRERGVDVWKALRPQSEAELAAGASRYAGRVDALLIEGYSSVAAGGTGTRFPHEWLAGADADTSDQWLVLAGGLRPDNVADAIATGHPDVVDVSSGVERAPGEKDRGMINAFVAAVRAAHRTA